MNTPDWNADAKIILEQSIISIEDFTLAHPAEVCSFLAFGVNYYEGWISLNFDTPSNSMKKARRRASQVRQTQHRLLQYEEGWRDVRYDLARQRMNTVGMEMSDFKYYLYKEFTLPTWQTYFYSLEDSDDPSGHIVILFLKVVHDLLKEKAFSRLSISSPFLLGVQFVDDALGMLLLDILNWPEATSLDPCPVS